MTIRKILTEPDPFLRQKSEKVEEVNKEIQRVSGGDYIDIRIKPNILPLTHYIFELGNIILIF